MPIDRPKISLNGHIRSSSLEVIKKSREGATTELSRMNKDLEVVDQARAFPKKQKLKWKRAKLTNAYLGYKNFYTEG